MPVAIVRFVGKRLFNNRALLASTAIGLLVTVTLVTSVPLYAEGISGLLLQRELRKPIPQAQPASSVFVRHLERDPEVPTSAADYLAYDQFFSALIPEAVGLPTTQMVSYLATGRRAMVDVNPSVTDEKQASPRRFGFFWIFSEKDFFENVVVTEGRRPSAEVESFIGPFGVTMPLFEGVMSSNALDKLGLMVGDVAGMQFPDPKTQESTLVAIRVVGRVLPHDPEGNYWFYPPRASLDEGGVYICLLYTSPSPRDATLSRMPSSA